MVETLVGTLSSYKDFLIQIEIIIFSHSFSLFDLLIYIFITLSLSAYFSVMGTLKHNTFRLESFLAIDKSKHNIFRLKYFELLNFCSMIDLCSMIADFFYLVTILVLPVSFVAFYFISHFFSFIVYISLIVSHFFSNSFTSTLSKFYEQFIPYFISFIDTFIFFIIVNRTVDIIAKEYFPHNLKQQYIASIIVGIFLLFVIVTK